jgi:glutathione reductase (NADPH)
VPAVRGLGLDRVGVETGKSGVIKVDGYSQTNIPSIYAVGDVTNRANLTPVAIHEGVCFVETVFHGNPTQPDHALIPTAVFTQPEIGTVGMGEEEASKTGKIDVYVAEFKPMMHTLAGKEERMLMKMIVAQESQKVLGVHIVGHAAGEMIQMAGIAVKMGATKADFDATMAVHPTASEELVTLKAPTRST